MPDGQGKIDQLCATLLNFKIENCYIYFSMLRLPKFDPMKTYTALYFFSLVVLIMAAYIIVYITEFNMLYIAGILSLVGLILNMLAFLGILSIKKHA